jgi:glycosyltransferase involved in cell wall biosynthesis
MEFFNQILLEDGQLPLDSERPYLVQIARFDPSKGIPDVLDAYRQLRHMLEEQQQPIPQLIIAGNGSIDDPDGKPIYNLIKRILQTEPYRSFANDIKVARLPHRDQVLNTLLRKSKVVLQLSIKEGFEVKVTEALLKGKPVVAYRAGGIPLQIQDTVTGYLVETGNTAQVAMHLYELLTNEQLYQSMSNSAEVLANKDYLTTANAICWLYLATELREGGQLEGNYRWVRSLSQQIKVEEAA